MANIVKSLQEQPNFYAMTGASIEDIKMAEQALGLHFAAEYSKYVAAYGAVSFSNHELTGICKSKRLNVVDVTIQERSKLAVPNNWYVVEQLGIDDMVIWQASSGEIHQTSPIGFCKKIYKSLSDYILKTP